MDKISKEVIELGSHIEYLQQRQDECIVALGSIGCLPSELPTKIAEIKKNLDNWNNWWAAQDNKNQIAASLIKFMGKNG